MIDVVQSTDAYCIFALCQVLQPILLNGTHPPVAGIAEQEHIMHLVPSPNVVRALCNQNPNIVVVEMKNNRNRFMLRLPLQIEPILQALNEYPSGRQ